MFLTCTTRLFNKIVWASCVAFIFFSCTVVKNYQPNKPFVFENKIILNGKVSKDEKKRLTEELYNYWDDSLKVKKLQTFGIKYTIKKPPVFDSINIARSIKFMNAYLNSQGYYYANIKDSSPVKIDTVKDQLRTTIIMKIDLGKNITIDSVSYTLQDTLHNTPKDSILQNLALQHFNNTYLIKGKPYTKQVISDELDRFVSLLRSNGYYKFSREHVFALVDTSNAKLLKLTLDPIEQAKLIAEADRQRRDNPTWDVDIRQKENTDSARLTKFYIGNVYYYPETKFTEFPDSLIVQKWIRETPNKKGDLIIRDHIGKFKLRPLREHTFLRKDSLYNEDNYIKSINTLSQIPAWKQVDARIVQRSNDTLDLHFFLEPAIKQSITYNLETSRNSNDFSSGNLLGLALSATYINRNLWKQAIQSNTSLRAGVELNFDTLSTSSNLIQTFQIGLSHSYSFPRLIFPIKAMNQWFRKVDGKKTLVAAGASYTERLNTYRLRQLTVNYSWEWQKKNNIFALKPLNLEFYKIDTLPLLDTIFKQNPFLRNSFNNGNVVGASFYWTKNFTQRNNRNKSHFIRLGIDESGLFLFFLPTDLVKKWQGKIYEYVKLEADYRFTHKYIKSEFAYRFYSGVGIPFGGQSLPFFKQFSAGGPNSMRAWGLRQLGLGSSTASDTIAANNFRDRFGDLQLETNLEYRFTLFNVNGFKIGSALYADIGNVWNVKKDATNPGSEFSIKHFGRDIAIGIGTGLRFDFNYFLVRVDFAYKAKDPGRAENGGWMSIKNFKWKEDRTNFSQTEVRNYAFQLGIGLPF